ncbi:MAG TPA: hypothetical protein VFH54_03835, partial [Mycobacteriales bacterium]|nr:hypothetical protein [Mycobacteriales bacterium]
MTADPGSSGGPMSERMQSLLSRAVEDQLSEQRQVAQALTELRAQLARVAQDIASLGSGSGDEAASGAIAGVAAEVRDAVRMLGERLDGVARMVQQRGVDLAEIKASVAELQDAVRAHSNALAGVSGGLGVQEHVDGLAQELREVRSAFTGIAARVAEQPARTDLDKLSATLAGRIDELVGEINRLKAATEPLRILPDLQERLGRPDGLDIAE